MNFKASVFMLALAGIGLGGCSSLGLGHSSGTSSNASYAGASQPQPAYRSPASAAGQTAAANVGSPEAQKQESAFRQLDANHDGVIDRQEFDALKLM
ncbi:MAG TPA: EF-hand domain-containing protein [Burkholderiales bacterium]|jgi:hypothetical protein|nr:EF-hand domain-containing protein [Burkholderiales bacterium]